MPRKCVHDTAPDSLHNPWLLSSENFAGTVFFARGLQWGVSGIVVTMPPLLVVGYVARRSHRLNFMPLSGLLSCATTDPARPDRRVRHGPPRRPRRLRLSPHHAAPHRRRTDHRADRLRQSRKITAGDKRSLWPAESLTRRCASRLSGSSCREHAPSQYGRKTAPTELPGAAVP
jgi:hypothetical protein